MSSTPARPEHRALVEAAWAARDNAYAPYSGFAVGAAALGRSGRIYPGVNVENASSPAGTCAERAAILAAVTAGERELVAMAIATDTAEPTPPCGICRQTMAEFAPDLEIVLCGAADRTEVLRLGALLPRSFGPADLARATGRPGPG